MLNYRDGKYYYAVSSGIVPYPSANSVDIPDALKHSEKNIRNILKSLSSSNFVLNQEDVDSLLVSGLSSSITIHSGAAVLQGYHIFIESTESLDLTTYIPSLTTGIYSIGLELQYALDDLLLGTEVDNTVLMSKGVAATIYPTASAKPAAFLELAKITIHSSLEVTDVSDTRTYGAVDINNITGAVDGDYSTAISTLLALLNQLYGGEANAATYNIKISNKGINFDDKIKATTALGTSGDSPLPTNQPIITFGPIGPYTSANMQVNGFLRANRVYNPYYNDYAEWYLKGEDISYGDIVAVNIKDGKYYRATSATGKYAVGVCSDSYGSIVGGTEDLGKTEADYAPIALCGRVYVNVLGKVKAGDYIVASQAPGVGKRKGWLDRGRVIGIALENKESYLLDKILIQVMLK